MNSDVSLKSRSSCALFVHLLFEGVAFMKIFEVGDSTIISESLLNSLDVKPRYAELKLQMAMLNKEEISHSHTFQRRFFFIDLEFVFSFF